MGSCRDVSEEGRKKEEKRVASSFVYFVRFARVMSGALSRFGRFHVIYGGEGAKQ
ncbi:hypothetical protein ACRALDRAFT_2034830, partial [Sodiomyces alcalophilus JCM 7366]|uniref:uncharacterized protein n=1 Tax=Sodiomyces alcalophilus JCM 7366 TaxID=591952 RepID=UPI0039B4FAA8